MRAPQVSEPPPAPIADDPSTFHGRSGAPCTAAGTSAGATSWGAEGLSGPAMGRLMTEEMRARDAPDDCEGYVRPARDDGPTEARYA